MENITIHQAAADGNVRQAQELIESNPTLINARDKFCRAPLHVALEYYFAKNLHTELVQFLLKYGAHVDALDKDGKTPLHYAAFWNHAELAQLLLEYGADVNAFDQVQRMPLHYAAIRSHAEVVQLLLSHRAHVNAIDSWPTTPLYCSINFQNEKMVQLLLQHGAAVNARNLLGETALNSAARYGYAEMVRILLRHGANVNAQNCKGRNSLDLAHEKGHAAVVQLLKDWPVYQIYRNRQIAAFLAGKDPQVGKDSLIYYNLDCYTLNYIVQFIRSEWNHDTIEQIHGMAERERALQILALIYAWVNNHERSIIKK